MRLVVGVAARTPHETNALLEAKRGNEPNRRTRPKEPATTGESEKNWRHKMEEEIECLREE